ncbi:MAG: hypothetical protein ACHQ7M_21155, partial [Chloroflexota bacterium]
MAPTEMAPSRLAYESFEDLVSHATSRAPLLTGDQKGGSNLERLVVDGATLVAKHLDLEGDWLMRCTSDLACRPLVLWRSGLLDQLPPCIDHAIVACYPGAKLGQAVLVMRDVSSTLIPEGDQPVLEEQHLRLVDHMAALHARFWGWTDQFDLLPLADRLLEFHPDSAKREIERPDCAAVPPIIVEGWRKLTNLAPVAAETVFALHRDPSPLVAALEQTPRTFVHGDWKMGNLGSHPDGRTVLLDWAVPGEAPGALDFAWYLSINRRRLPCSKEQAIEDVGFGLAEWVDYFQRVAALPLAPDTTNHESLVDALNASGFAVIGTVEDAVTQV